MTKDLEATLRELGPDYGRLVERLRAPFEERPRERSFRSTAYLVAASLVAALAVAAVFRPSDRGSAASAAAYPRCYTVALKADSAAIRELIATQRPDGSWASDFLTCQNAAALRGVQGAELAYRKALRYLKSKGLEPVSQDELRVRSSRLSHTVASVML